MTLTPRGQERLQVLNEVVAGRWSVEQAAQVLGLSVRHVWRLMAAYGEEGAAALAHGNCGRPSTRSIPEEVRQQVLTLVRGPYAGCNDSHLVELLAEREGIVVGRETLRRLLRAAGLRWVRQRRAPKRRRRRDRMPQAGMLLQVDGSPYRWLGADRPCCVLLAAIDDATGEVVAAVFRDQEDSHGYFLLLAHVLRERGLPLALYHDRHGIFQRDAKVPWTLAEQVAGYPAPTQFGWALEELGIISIAARSPQAKGRIERLWGTLQDRLVAELRLAGVQTIADANAFLPAFLARSNARFAVRGDDPGHAYGSLDAALDLERVLSFRYPRVVGNDNTVRLDGQVLHIPPGPGRRSYARAHVLVHEFLDASFGVWYQDRWLLRTSPPAQAKPLRARQRGRERAEVLASSGRAVAIAPTPKPTGPRHPPATHPWRRPFKTPTQRAAPRTESRGS